MALATILSYLAPAASVAATLAATPLIFDPAEFDGKSFSLLELAIVAGTVGIGLRIALSCIGPGGRERFKGLFRPWHITLGALALLGVACISLMTLADPDHRKESLRVFRLVIVEPLFFLGVCRWVLTDPWARRLAVIGLCGMGAIIGTVAVGQVVFSDGGVLADGVRRATASYPHPNNLSLFLERAGLVALGAALAGFPRRIAVVVAVLCLGGLLATFSRGAVAATAVTVIFLAGRAIGRRNRWWLVGGIGAVAIGFIIVAGQRVLDTGSTGTESTRVLIWRASFRMIRDHPIWGIGLDQFFSQYRPRYVEPAGWPERYTSHPHDLVLDVWLSLGILGLVVFAWLGMTVFATARRGIARVDARERGLALGAAGALLAGVMHGFVDNGFFLADLAVLTWFFVALLEIYAQLPAARDEQKTGESNGRAEPVSGSRRVGLAVPLDAPG